MTDEGCTYEEDIDTTDLAVVCYQMYMESLIALVVAVVGLVLGLSVLFWWVLA